MLRSACQRALTLRYVRTMVEGGSTEATPSAPTVSVVICTFDRDRFADLRAALVRIDNQVPRPNEVVVVVNGDEELAQEVASTLPCVVVVEGAHAGVSAARELGVQMSTGDVIAFIDDDALAEPSWLSGLIEPFQRPEVMMTSGRINPLWLTGRPSWFPDEFLWVVGCSYRGLPDSGEALRNPIGASMAIRRSVVNVVGTFESRLGRVKSDGNGCEETEYAIRAHRALPDGVVVFAGASMVQHLVPKARTTFAYFMKRCWREGRSKAILVQIAGRGESLSVERSYVRRVLPHAVLRALRTPSTWGQAAAIVMGFAATAFGFSAFSITTKVEAIFATSSGRSRSGGGQPTEHRRKSLR